MALFHDRVDAGRQLAARLTAYAGRPDVIVLGLPRGGVPVAAEVARRLQVPLDVFVVRKLGAPQNPELAMGAIASGGVQVLNEEVVEALQISAEEIREAVAAERKELERRERLYRGDRPMTELRGRIVIVVDDGLATGSTMRAAIKALRQYAPAAIIIAVPVAASSTCAELRSQVDALVCLATPEPFRAVGLWYEDFSQTTDEEVYDLLRESGDRGAGAARESDLDPNPVEMLPE